MVKLIALLALAGAAAAGLVYWSKRGESFDDTWTWASDTTSDWANTASREAGKAADSVASAASSAADTAAKAAGELKDSLPNQ
jgi:hypothetical protein